MKILKAFVLAGFLAFGSWAQAQVQHSGWIASFNTFKLNARWSLHFDAQLRSNDDLENIQTVLLRPGLNYHFKKGMLSAGYAAVFNRRTAGGYASLLAEHRTWQQAILNTPFKNIAIAHRFRFEQRFIPQAVVRNGDVETGDHATAYRFRYFIRNIIPLVRAPKFTKGPFAAVQNEVFLNTGDKAAVNGKTFDQNRLYLAVGYRLQNKLDLEAGYLNQYIEGRSGFTNNHVVQLAVYKRL